MVGGVACVTAETTRAAEAAPLHPPSRDHWGCCPTADDRINAYIEEEVQRRLKKLNLLNGDNNLDLSLSSRSLKEETAVSDDEKLNNKVDPRRLKYERLVSVPLGPSPESLKDPVKISIPRYVLRGQGKDEHFEFEVKITVLDETWTVFRRYSRFREMHKSLKMKYPELGGLEFPPKKLFGNRDERMVSERRNHLEVCSSDAGTFFLLHNLCLEEMGKVE
ncbi:hypothetical protein AALO_G00097580 [Alosa alosa]|uniref:PX domain-containing protein n=1 Tax=Alosa alosa TaxID=278164 RepID=A0AAV6GT09_9TELE|nr:hypothetical protein AALO_G00097580 [Alosa alosa]